MVLAIAQLMVVLDVTIVNIALPQAQQDLGISDADRQWVVTAYTLAFGGLLLLGGRVADYWGRKRAFIVGSIGFAIASALGGVAQTGELLFAARALQGVFGALLAPAGLALLTVLFTEAKERAKAFAVYGAIAGGGAAVGLLLGGALTEYADWRWCLLVNVPFALLAVVLAVPLVPESKAQGNTRYDVPGAVTATLGLVSLVYGFTQAAEPGKGWGSWEARGFILAGLALLAVFVFIEMKSSHPLLPLRILFNRTRGGSYLASMLIGAAMFGSFFFLTYYFQIVLQYTPLEAGMASLPVTAGVFIAAGLASNLVPRFGSKPLMVVGAVLASAGMLLLTRIEVTSSFGSTVLPGELILGLGMGFVFVPLSNLALVGVPEHDAGAASATLNATQQVGGSLGVALLNTFYTTAVTGYVASHLPPTPLVAAEGLVHGSKVVFAWSAGMMVIAAIVAAIVINARKSDLPTGPAAVHVG
ncbi:MAG TPA: MFS transporter [Micromonosporaceae bacterium]|nr:MFS transporter [Micromonosporaceae bacterium]HCU49271.1 MFS transporter [Micromonosporaceae bacterium]